jgi:hypothetical protein
LAERLQFLIANPSVREAAGRAAQLRIRRHYQWNKIAEEVERVYFETMGWERLEAPLKKPAASVTAATINRRAG